MKRIAIITGSSLAVIAALVFATSEPAQADLWTALKNSSLPKGEATAGYTVPTTGLDVRVFEFTPKANSNITCVMAFGQTNPVGLQCFEKE